MKAFYWRKPEIQVINLPICLEDDTSAKPAFLIYDKCYDIIKNDDRIVGVHVTVGLYILKMKNVMLFMLIMARVIGFFIEKVYS